MAYAIPLVLPRILVVLLLLVLSSLAATASAKGKIGVAYGLNGDNLLSPGQTVALLRSKGVKRVRSYEARPAVTRAFANSGIDLIIGVPNAEVPGLAASAGAAISWVTTNVVPFPTTRISAIIVGNEWLADSSNNFSLLVPAMQNIYKALSTLRVSNVKLQRIKVSTSHSLSVLSRPSFPPSKAKFSKRYVAVMRPLLDFLRKTGSYFMVNVVPYFAYMEAKNISLEFVLFEATGAGVTDPNTGLHYTNLFDLQIDAVYAAIAALSRVSPSSISASSLCAYCNTSSEDVLTSASKKQKNPKKNPKVVGGESGWPSKGKTGSKTAPKGAQHGHFFLPPGSAFSSAAMPSRSSDAHMGDSHLNHHATLRNTSGTLPSTKMTSFLPSHITPPVSPLLPCGSMHNHATSTSSSKVRPHLTSSSSTTTSTIEERHCSTRAPYAEKIVRSELAAATIANARTFNQNLIRHVLSAKGTPAHPTTPIQAFVFEIFNEDLKPPGIEQHFGIYYPNGTAVYPINFHPRV